MKWTGARPSHVIIYNELRPLAEGSCADCVRGRATAMRIAERINTHASLSALRERLGVVPGTDTLTEPINKNDMDTVLARMKRIVKSTGDTEDILKFFRTWFDVSMEKDADGGMEPMMKAASDVEKDWKEKKGPSWDHELKACEGRKRKKPSAASALAWSLSTIMNRKITKKMMDTFFQSIKGMKTKVKVAEAGYSHFQTIEKVKSNLKNKMAMKKENASLTKEERDLKRVEKKKKDDHLHVPTPVVEEEESEYEYVTASEYEDEDPITTSTTTATLPTVLPMPLPLPSPEDDGAPASPKRIPE